MSHDLPACRFCGKPLHLTLVDLGRTPLANSYLEPRPEARAAERAYPLHARVCTECFLVQVEDSVPPDAIFSDYAYFSSCEKGVETDVAFFGTETARRLVARGISADLTAANNVLAHVPDIRDFAQGFQILLKPQGVSTFEFPHVLRLIEELQFDTIYHEHFSYLSLVAVEKIFASVGLRIFDVEKLPTHGGSLRLFVCRQEAEHQETPRVAALHAEEKAAKLDEPAGYTGYAARVEGVKQSFKAFLARAKAEGKTVAAYGAAAKGNTFLNVCGVTTADIPYVFDRSLAKQGKLLPGTHIPVVSPERIAEIRPDYLVILPWNLAEEIRSQADLSAWGGRHVIAVPETRVL
jgi:hypothetical protein